MQLVNKQQWVGSHRALLTRTARGSELCLGRSVRWSPTGGLCDCCHAGQSVRSVVLLPATPQTGKGTGDEPPIAEDPHVSGVVRVWVTTQLCLWAPRPVLPPPFPPVRLDVPHLTLKGVWGRGQTLGNCVWTDRGDRCAGQGLRAGVKRREREECRWVKG